jgi:hypothetical protein
MNDSLQSFRLLFVGGCHVVGHPFGPGYGFPKIAQTKLERMHPDWKFQLKVVPHVLLSDKQKVLHSCGEFHPDVLVLQLGHYESARPLKQRIRKLFSKRGLLAKAPSTKNSHKTYEFSLSHRIECSRWPTPKKVLKFILDLALRGMGCPGIGIDVARHDISLLFDALRGAKVQHVVVMSPFAGPSAVINRYRRELATVLAEKAYGFGFTYFDLADLFGGAFSHKRVGLYCDEQHLTVKGETLVGGAVASVIDGLLSAAKLPAETRRASAPELACQLWGRCAPSYSRSESGV